MLNKKNMKYWLSCIFSMLIIIIKTFIIINLVLNIMLLIYIVHYIDEYVIVLTYITECTSKYVVFYTTIAIHLLLNTFSLLFVTGYVQIKKKKILVFFMFLFIIIALGINNTYLLLNDISVLTHYSNNWMMVKSLDNEIIYTVSTANETVETVESNSNYLKKTLISISVVAFIIFIGYHASVPYLNSLQSIINSSNSNITTETVNNIGNLPIPLPLSLDTDIKNSDTNADILTNNHSSKESTIVDLDLDEVTLPVLEDDSSKQSTIVDLDLDEAALPILEDDSSKQSTIVDLDLDEATLPVLEDDSFKQSTIVDLSDVDIITLDEGKTHLIVDNILLSEMETRLGVLNIDNQTRELLFALLQKVRSLRFSIDNEETLFNLIINKYKSLDEDKQAIFIKKLISTLNNCTDLMRFSTHVSLYDEDYVACFKFAYSGNDSLILNDIKMMELINDLLSDLLSELKKVQTILLENEGINPTVIKHTNVIADNMEKLLAKPIHDISYYREVCTVLLKYRTFPMDISNYISNIIIQDVLISSLNINLDEVADLPYTNTNINILDPSTNSSRVIKCFLRFVDVLFDTI